MGRTDELAVLRTIRAAGALALAFAAVTGCGGEEAEGGPQGAVIDTVHVRTEDVASFVQAHEAVHLAREADAGLSDAELRQRGFARTPPDHGILLGPAGLR